MSIHFITTKSSSTKKWCYWSLSECEMCKAKRKFGENTHSCLWSDNDTAACKVSLQLSNNRRLNRSDQLSFLAFCLYCYRSLPLEAMVYWGLTHSTDTTVSAGETLRIHFETIYFHKYCVFGCDSVWMCEPISADVLFGFHETPIEIMNNTVTSVSLHRFYEELPPWQILNQLICIREMMYWIHVKASEGINCS